MATEYINFGSFENWAAKIQSDNDKLLQHLNEICAKINSLGDTYQSNASTTIREKITGMKPRFEQYYQVIDSYARFVKATGEAYRATEITNNDIASDFL
ncbi:MAG: WXG100 family type VII secretion target [Lachnospiraceae bacterium]|nr:WXG100 family type VII secretion target [Lachnospiraceae bacterium]